jgi:hypothetical protein
VRHQFTHQFTLKVGANVLMAFDGPTILDCWKEASLPQRGKQDWFSRGFCSRPTLATSGWPLSITRLSTVLICSSKVLSAVC